MAKSYYDRTKSDNTGGSETRMNEYTGNSHTNPPSPASGTLNYKNKVLSDLSKATQLIIHNCEWDHSPCSWSSMFFPSTVLNSTGGLTSLFIMRSDYIFKGASLQPTQLEISPSLLKYKDGGTVDWLELNPSSTFCYLCGLDKLLNFSVPQIPLQ